ncbi:hypothetical protein [Streptomyces turgidiscabies]|uniref:hypothetical protein n=1 Tax=Streptomyces turgidiscabies TaxID=85558 RepID=UPI0038F72ED9
MRRQDDIECTVTLDLADISEVDASRLVQVARQSGHQVDVAYGENDSYRIHVDFGDDLGGARSLIAEVDRLEESYGDRD